MSGDNDIDFDSSGISATGLASTLAAIWAALNMSAALSIPSIFEEAALEAMATWFMYGFIVYGWVVLAILAVVVVAVVGGTLWWLAGKTA